MIVRQGEKDQKESYQVGIIQQGIRPGRGEISSEVVKLHLDNIQPTS